MSVVSAYVDLPKWDTLPGPDSAFIAEGDIFTRTEGGLDVSWVGEEPPNGAQVYIEWTPRVYAVWEEEEQEDESGNQVEQPGPGAPEEAHEGSGQGGAGFEPGGDGPPGGGEAVE